MTVTIGRPTSNISTHRTTATASEPAQPATEERGPETNAVNSFEAGATASTPLAFGASGPAVKWLQAALVQRGVLSASDAAAEQGEFKAKTEWAVRRFQARLSLVPNGVVTADVHKALQASQVQPLRVMVDPIPAREVAEVVPQPLRVTVDPVPSHDGVPPVDVVPVPLRPSATPVATAVVVEPAVPLRLHLGNDLADPLGHPTLQTEDLQSGVTYEAKRVTGPLFGANGPRAEDVNQGQAGDCYFLSTLASIAQTTPAFIRELIRDEGDGTFTVTFKGVPDRFGKPTKVRVDDVLFARRDREWQMPAYSRGDHESWAQGESMAQQTTWAPLVEKAYAKLKGGSYESIGHGGQVSDVMAELLGRPSQVHWLSSTSADEAWRLISAAVKANDPICASTIVETSQALFTNSGLVANHAYSILGVAEHDGERFIRLRNPWGDSEPGNDGKNDGIFEFKLADFMKYYGRFETSPAKQVKPAPFNPW